MGFGITSNYIEDDGKRAFDKINTTTRTADLQPCSNWKEISVGFRADEQKGRDCTKTFSHRFAKRILH